MSPTGKAADLDNTLNALENQVGGLRQELAGVRQELAGLRQTVESTDAGLGNDVASLQMQTRTLQQLVEGLRQNVAALQQRVDGLEQTIESDRAAHERDLRDRTMTLLTTVLRQRTRAAIRPDATLASPHAGDLEACVDELRRAAPAAFEHWHRRLDANARAYEGFPVDSCSVGGHEMAELFGRFLRPYLTGPTLDVGCGPQPVPSYLAGHPHELLAGIDPLDAPHPYAFVRTVAEHLPWPDGTFDLVVVATSLDHVLLLDRALDEVHRVLRPDGRLAVWVSFVDGAPAYDPYREPVTPIDEHHLFHFDRPWFDEVLSERFVQTEIIPFMTVNGSCFAACEPRGSADA